MIPVITRCLLDLLFVACFDSLYDECGATDNSKDGSLNRDSGLEPVFLRFIAGTLFLLFRLPADWQFDVVCNVGDVEMSNRKGQKRALCTGDAKKIIFELPVADDAISFVLRRTGYKEYLHDPT